MSRDMMAWKLYGMNPALLNKHELMRVDREWLAMTRVALDLAAQRKDAAAHQRTAPKGTWS